MKLNLQYLRCLYFLAFGLWGVVGVGQGTETFSNICTGSCSPAVSSYGSRSWTGDDGSTWTATNSRTDQTINGAAMTMNDDNGNTYIESGTITGGIGDLSITTQRKFTGGSGNLTVLVNGNSVGTVPYGTSSQTTTITGIDITGNVVIRIQNDLGGSNGGGADRVAVDDITWTGLSGPENPSNISASVISSTQIDLEYEDNTDGDDIIIVFDTDNTFSTPTGVPPTVGNTFAGGTVLFNGNGNGTFNHTGLTSNTTYYYKAWSFDGTDYSAGIEESATTPCNAITSFPFTEGFESSNSIPDCWTSYRGTNGIGTGEDWQIDTNFNTANTGNNSAYVSYENVTGGNAQDWLVTPPLDLSSINNTELSFFAVDEFIYDFGTEYTIRVSTSSQTDISSFTTVETYDESVFTDFYTEFIVDLSAYDGQTIYIAFVMEQDDGDSWYLDDVEVRQGFDKNTLIKNTTQPSGSIIADVNFNASNKVDVFKFEIEDQGTLDTTPTEITQLRFVPGTANTASWEQNIQGISITSSGAGGILAQDNQDVFISDTEIIVDITDNSFTEMTIPDGTTQEYTISIFLNTSGIDDDEVIQLSIEPSLENWQTGSTSSELETLSAGFSGNPFTIEVIGNTYEFITQPIDVVVNTEMPVDVEIAYIDSNGNVDRNFTSDVQITSSGNLQASTLNATPLDGVATFSGSDIVHTVIEDNVILTATSSVFPSGIISNPFNVTNLPELIITEVADPVNNDGRFVEIYNSGVNSLNLSTISYFLHNDAGSGTSVQLTGTIYPKYYYVVALNNGGGLSEFNTLYGFAPNLISGIVDGNGDSAYYLSRDDNQASLIDIYGVLNQDGTGEPWEYEDSRAYRNNPTVKNANTTWTASEWTIQSNANVAEMTPGYGDNDYIYENGWLNLNTGLSDPNGSSNTSQNIFVKSGTVSLNQDTEIGDLVVRSGATLELEPNVKLTVHGDIVNEGTIIFESDATSTAVLEAVDDTGPNVTRVAGDGFVIHRRIPINPGHRAFRYLSSSVDTQNSLKPTIYDNWQEAGTTPSGFGTHITGAIGPVGGISPQGFDFTSSGNPSMYFWDNLPDNSTPNPNDQIGWTAIPSTNTTNDTFSVGDAYAILIRGDRSSTLSSNTLTGPSTTLRTTGRIHVGDFEVLNLSNTVGHFNLVGNPYQSQVDLVDLLKNNSQEVDDNYAYVWDPTIGTLGGYAYIDLNTPANSESFEFGQTTPLTSNANQYLQPQQAFFVETTGNSPEITFTENVKVNTVSQTATFSENEPDFSVLDLTLKGDNGLTYDGVRLVYGNTFSNGINGLDAAKLWNYTDNFSILSNNNHLSVEKRDRPSDEDLTQLNLHGLSLSSYSIEASYYAANPDFSVYLLDSYTGLSHQILPNQQFSYSFSIDAGLPETYSADRFSIIYNNTTLGNASFDTDLFRLYPNPLPKDEQLNIELKGHQSLENIALLNLNGQLIEEFNADEVDISQNNFSIKFKSSIPSGTYLLKIYTKQNSKTFKIIIN